MKGVEKEVKMGAEKSHIILRYVNFPHRAVGVVWESVGQCVLLKLIPKKAPTPRRWRGVSGGKREKQVNKYIN